MEIYNRIKNLKVSTVIFTVALVLFSTNIQSNGKLYILSLILLSMGVLYDTILFFKLSHNKYWEKFIFIGFSIVGYFAYVRAESFARADIYSLTGLEPNTLGTALAYLKGIYFIPAVMLILGFVISFVLILVFFLSFVPILSEIVGLNEQLREKIKEKIWYFFRYVVAIGILSFAYFMNYNDIYEALLGKQYIAKSIIKYSYVPNKFCKNTDINKGTYIKVIKKKASVTNIINYNQLDKNNDINITFNVKDCNDTRLL